MGPSSTTTLSDEVVPHGLKLPSLRRSPSACAETRTAPRAPSPSARCVRAPKRKRKKGAAARSGPLQPPARLLEQGEEPGPRPLLDGHGHEVDFRSRELREYVHENLYFFLAKLRRMPTANAEGKVSGQTRLSVPSDRHGSSAFAVGMLRDVEENATGTAQEVDFRSAETS